ncbi:sigma 54-interacting transcriptional regulator [Companilactobacillus kimchiensis]|uniref:Sigma-54 dependent DNA-binding response regulator n=1 Tax=Companilactobacillus kimchiensis TaxID=993692 RepID=A0A0R2L2T7_9LACO|nr:sigma 54-interacting transcriptional regulator [Companilactobacillus kimchiensis]KRN95776.1 sigma-54 dependent DNA-binding response regulator [Companilactobacillus kimchiensis]
MPINKIEEYLEKISKAALESKKFELLETSTMAQRLNLSRSTVSRYLNNGYKDGVVTKIQTHPVKYISFNILKKNFKNAKLDYDSIDDVLNEDRLHKNTSIDIFDNVIGSEGSLINQIEEIKTATLYPGKGLPIMLMGPSGSGKTFLANKIYQYCIQKNLIAQSSKFQFLNCAQYFNNPELLSSILFGYTKGAFTGADQDTPGLIENANGGVLFLDEVHRLTQSGQEKLFSFMDTGQYSPIGNDSIKRKASVRLIFATTEKLDSTFLPTFVRRIPVIINIPSFSMRPQSEKVQLIDYFFMNESKVLKRKLSVSTQLVDVLLSANMEGNIGKLKNIIKYSSGNAYAKSGDVSKIKINLSNIPVNYYQDLIQYKKFENDPTEYINYDFESDVLPHHTNKIINVIKDLYVDTINMVWVFLNNKVAKKQFLNHINKNVDLLFDSILFNTEYKSLEDSEYEFLIYQIKSVFDFMENSYGYPKDGNQIIAIATLLRSKNLQSVLNDNKIWNLHKSQIINELKSNFDSSYQIATRILSLLSNKMERDILEEDILMVTLYVAKNKSNISKGLLHAVVLAHGYSTASSLANVANRMLKSNLFQSIDMPIDTTTKDIESKLVDYINTVNIDKGMILLIDMGSLNQIGQSINEKLNVPILMIDHVSTPLVLNVGNLILQNKGLSDIRSNVKENNVVNSKILLPHKKQKKAIITCCHSGMGSAVQIQEIIKNSLKKFDVNIEILPYDFNKLSKNKRNELPFELYDVIAIVGTANPQIGGVPYLSLDGLLSGNHIDQLIEILNNTKSMDYSDLKDALLMNFTIKRMISSITILDPNSLIKLADSTVSKMEELLSRKFKTNKRVLLIIHESGMVERLIRNQELDRQSDIVEFKSKHREMFEIIKKSMEPIEQHYNIKINPQEVRLIVEIILGDD